LAQETSYNQMSNKTYVLDTSVCLTESSCLYKFEDNNIVIPLKVLEEIDNHKKRQDAVGLTARKIIKIFDSLRGKGNLQEGVQLRETNPATLKVVSGATRILPEDLDKSIADNVIISTALLVKASNPEREVIMVSRDINMRVICDSLKIKSEDYSSDKVLDDESNLYDGSAVIMVDEDIVDRFYSGEDIFTESLDVDQKLYPNQLITLISTSNEKHAALARFIAPRKPLKLLYSVDKKGLWGVRHRNKEQAFAFDLLLDPKIPFVSLVGKAGSGKTLLAIAAGISQVIHDPFQTAGQENAYRKLVISRPVQPMGKDIGFLPGTLEEKMHPWLMPIQDNLQFIMGSDKLTIEDYTEKGVIEIEALTYIRGRSISNAFIIIDEAQNLSMHEIKTIMTRVGENTKIVLTGDVEQIDNIYVDETSTGLVHAVEKFKTSELSGHITLKKGERSAIATLAAKIL
jgi:PhoH-like ATPase